MFDPKIEFLMSESNEDKTSGDFREMGLRLAQEVIAFLKKKMDKATRHGVLGDIKLSFVGHSIGNVIIRTALAGKRNIGLVCLVFRSFYCSLVLDFLCCLLQKALWSHT